MKTVGIDPGLFGAIAVIYPPVHYIGAPEKNYEVRFYDTPIVKVGDKNFIDGAAAADHLFQLEPDLIVLEKIHAIPGQNMSSSAMFNFGMGYGIWLGIIAAYQYKHMLVAPVTWKKKMMPDMGKEKDASRVRALQIFPRCAEDLKLKKHHGRADALLLAEYGRLTQG